MEDSLVLLRIRSLGNVRLGRSNCAFPQSSGRWLPAASASATTHRMGRVTSDTKLPTGLVREFLRAAIPDSEPKAVAVGDQSGLGRFSAYPGNTLIARAITRIAVISEITASAIIVILAHIRTGSVSVGLNAVAFVNERYR